MPTPRLRYHYVSRWQTGLGRAVSSSGGRVLDDLERLTQALSDRYQIEGEIGSGGMATVYLAKDLKHRRRVAIKVLRPELAAGLGAERFVLEIEISAKLTHPHILPLFDSGEADGFLYYVMPFVEGESLRDRLERQGKLPEEEAIRLTDQVASALAYAHERGVIHRDIKPGNILLTGDQAIVADFGIARAVEAATAEGLTGTGLAVGTPTYMSPEQALGGEAVDTRTDVYALGCVVFEMVSGKLPFEGTGPQALLAKQMVDRGPSLRKADPGIPVFLDRAVSKAMATDPGERFETASAFAEALNTGTIVRRVRSRRQRQRTLIGAGVVVIVAAVWGIFQLFGGPTMSRIAVLPLEDHTNDPAKAYIAPGVHEALIAELGQLGLDLISPATMAQFRDSVPGVRELARELDVDGVMEGSVFQAEDSLEVFARLYDRNEQEVWSGTFDGVLPDLVAMYRGFAREIAAQIRLRLSPEREARLGEAPAVNQAVYAAYLRGMTTLQEATTAEEFEQAISFFQQAVAENPADALAHAGLAASYVTLGHNNLVSDENVWSRARAHAQRAISLDENSAEGWAALADYETYWGRDWEAAERAFQRANELNPSLAWNHYHYAWYLALFGRVEEAVAEHTRAKELDPLTPYHTTWLPALYWFSRDFEAATAEARDVVADSYADDFTANYVLGISAGQAGLVDEAMAAMERAAARFPGMRFWMGEVYAKLGREEEAMSVVQDLEAQPRSPANAKALARIYAALGNREEALDWLETEPHHFQLPWSMTWPEFDDLRDEPRFQAVARRLNLEYRPGETAPRPLPVVHPDLPAVSGDGSF